MKRSIIAVAVLAGLSTAHAANPNPSAYDRLQDIELNSNTQFNDYQQKKIVKNENDIRDLQNNTSRQFDQINQYVKSIDQARADSDANNGQAIIDLQRDQNRQDNQFNQYKSVTDNKIGDLQNTDKDIYNKIDALQKNKPKDGVNGKDGKDGAQGQKGDKGDKGDTGLTGATGATGAAGKDGVTTMITKKVNDVQTQAKVARNEKRIAKVEKDVKDIKRTVKSLGASAAASANLHYNRNESGYAVAVGEYEGATAIAGGVQFNTSSTTAVTVQASYDGEGVGASLGFHGNW